MFVWFQVVEIVCSFCEVDFEELKRGWKSLEVVCGSEVDGLQLHVKIYLKWFIVICHR